MAEKTRIAVIGLGNMGSAHCQDIASSEVCELAAVCDTDQAKADRFAEKFAVPAFYDYRGLLASGLAESVLVAVPHYDHVPLSVDSLERGVHVLVEKPITVTVKGGRSMVAAYEGARQQHPGLMFAIMFQQRTYGFWKKVKEMIDGGELGRLVRATWIITDWFRTQFYYDTGGWRATWKGEGGGVLLNQCPHNLDLYTWFFGTPRRVSGFASIGKHHNIEVEDEVTGYFEHDNGMVGHFITTTAESPGTNRLEIVGENGKLVYEAGRLVFVRNASSMITFLRESKRSFDKVPNETVEVSFTHHGQPGHKIMIENFSAAIQQGEPLIAPATEGLRSIALGNAVMLSSFEKRTVEIPFDEDLYEIHLNNLIAASRFQKGEIKTEDADMNASFQK